MNSLGKRVKETRSSLKMTQEEFGSKIGIKKNSLSQIESGKNSLTQQNIVAICKVFNVNESWLRTGEGEMFIELSEDDELKQLIDESMRDDSGEFKRRLAAAILKLTPEQIRICTNWIKENFLLDDQEAGESDQNPGHADQDPEERELTIDEKVESYRRELEAEAASEKSGALPPGKEA